MGSDAGMGWRSTRTRLTGRWRGWGRGGRRGHGGEASHGRKRREEDGGRRMEARVGRRTGRRSKRDVRGRQRRRRRRRLFPRRHHCWHGGAAAWATWTPPSPRRRGLGTARRGVVDTVAGVALVDGDGAYAEGGNLTGEAAVREERGEQVVFPIKMTTLLRLEKETGEQQT
ncbi:Os10g0503950 [Oryza sativa Japonica Group]|uniref:Os10g0503950 protein n=2 Tax=Oryza sativa subsp. japonica TaxID=39947 RepID=Q9FVY3_ORYSJ|nr:hypothetical protein [Oryza sativa Japonica Group]BAT11557.1 Os10g0503950 [Oryza sativa Japonica Group]